MVIGILICIAIVFLILACLSTEHSSLIFWRKNYNPKKSPLVYLGLFGVFVIAAIIYGCASNATNISIIEPTYTSSAEQGGKTGYVYTTSTYSDSSSAVSSVSSSAPAENPSSAPAKTSSQSNSSKAVSKAAPSEPEENNDGGFITKAKYDKIKNGMTYKQVKEIIGSDGEQEAEAGDEGTDIYTVIYSWKAIDQMGNAAIQFQGGKVIIKSQYGLK